MASPTTGCVLTFGLITTGARASFTNFSFFLPDEEADGWAVVGVDTGSFAGWLAAAGDTLRGRGDPPIKSLTSLLTSSLSLDSGSGDLARLLGGVPRVRSCRYRGSTFYLQLQVSQSTALLADSVFFCSLLFLSSSSFLRFKSISAFLSAMVASQSSLKKTREARERCGLQDSHMIEADNHVTIQHMVS